MSSRKERGRRRGPTERSSARRPVRARRSAKPKNVRARLNLSSKRAAGAAKVLGLSNTRRAAVVAIVMCALAFTLAVPLRTYLTQRAEIAEQEAMRTQLQDDVAELEKRRAQLADPGQIEAEARRRLRYVMPGETPYMVQLPEDKIQPQQQSPGQQTTQQGAWYEALWRSAN